MYKHPIEMKIHPKKIDKGTHWVTLEIKNVGEETLTGLDVNLNSLDSYCISVLGTGKYLMDLKSNEEEAIPFQVTSTGTGRLYATLDGWKEGEEFFWVSPNIQVRVGGGAAEFISLFAMTNPYPPLGETLKVEARIIGLEKSEDLSLEFWAEAPSGKFDELATIKTKELLLGEEATYTAEITPLEEGFYTIYSYLYDGVDRLDQRTETIWVRKD